MLALVLFVLVISAFAVFASLRLNKTFEEALPVSAMGIVLSLFLFGMINALKFGVIAVCIAAAGLYVYTIYWLIRKGGVASLKERIFNLITPASIGIAVLAGMLSYFNKDRLAMHTDEFSHWLDTVVIMCRIDAFGTAKGSGAIFPSYPPAMPLFQYLLEKINMTVIGDFSEWKVYFAYQLFAIIIMLPFVKVKGNNIWQKVASVITWPVCLVAPLYFFSEVYSSLYIDPFLGVLGGCGFAAISLTKEKDWCYKTYMTMLTAVLVLSKDVGIYLAIFISLYYVIDYIAREGIGKKQCLLSITPILTTLAAKMLWKLELNVSDTVQKFSQPFDIDGTIDTLKGQGTEFATTVYENFRVALTYRYIYYERLGFNYSAIMFLLVVAFVCLQVSLFKRDQLKKAPAIAGAVIPAVAIIFYILSMFPLYISRFAEEEALNLASFDRYCGIMFLTGVLFMVWLLRDLLLANKGNVFTLLIAVAALCSVFHSKKDPIHLYTSRDSVRESLAFRQQVNELATSIEEVCEGDSRVLVVLSDGQDIYRAILSTIAKPRTFDGSEDYFPNNLPENEADVISPNELTNIIKDEYDYVAIYDVNGTLIGMYSDIFENEEEIMNGAIFKMDKSTGKLALVNNIE